MSGVFIVFEGGDGAGKTTQAALLTKALEQLGHTVTVTREPGGTTLGRSIRELLLHGEYVDPKAEALLYAADRAHHVATVVRPALQRGEVVVQDRYIDSSVAYQGSGRVLGGDEIARLSEWATDGLTPDLTILLDVSADTGARRRAQETGTEDRIERAGDDFHSRVRQAFLNLAAAHSERTVVLDASRPVEELQREIWKRVETILPS